MFNTFYIQMDIGRAVKAFLDEINQPPRKVMVLGPTYSSEAAVIGDVSKYMDLVQVKHLAQNVFDAGSTLLGIYLIIKC